MSKCDLKQLEDLVFWFEKGVVKKQDRIIIPNNSGNTIIPSSRYPLSGPYEVFDYTNTHIIPLVYKDDIFKIMDSVDYLVGACYFNADAVTKAFADGGYNAKTYVGWLMFDPTCIIHHAWTVIELLGLSYVIDLSSHDIMIKSQPEYHNCANVDEERRMIVQIEKKLAKMPHSTACGPVGMVSPERLLVGAPSNKEEGIKIINDLKEKYPDHPAILTLESSGMTKTQELIFTTKN